MLRNRNFDDQYEDFDQPRYHDRYRDSPTDDEDDDDGNDYYYEELPSRGGRPQSARGSNAGPLGYNTRDCDTDPRKSNTGSRNSNAGFRNTKADPRGSHTGHRGSDTGSHNPHPTPRELYDAYHAGLSNPYDDLYEQDLHIPQGNTHNPPRDTRSNQHNTSHSGHDQSNAYSGLENNLRRGLNRPTMPTAPNHNPGSTTSPSLSFRLSNDHVRAHRAITRQISLGKNPKTRILEQPVASYDAPAVQEAFIGGVLFLPYLVGMAIALRAEGSGAARYGDDPPVFLGFVQGGGRWWVQWADE